MPAWRWIVGGTCLVSTIGCQGTSRPLFVPERGVTGERLPQHGIRVPLAAPQLEPAPLSAELLPAAPAETQPTVIDRSAPLTLHTVLNSVEQHFPLVLAAEQEFALAHGQQISAQGAFDLNFRTRVVSQGGTFSNDRLDTVLEQPTPLNGVNLLGGYRYGLGDFPVYYGDRQTADGGEFRLGAQIPLLRDAAIDRRRAVLAQAELGLSLADPIVRRVQLDARRAATKAYWNWLAAGEQYFVTQNLLRIAIERQASLQEQSKQGQISQFVVIDNRRLVIEREGVVVAAERRWQQTSIELSLYLRDPQGNPLVAQAAQLPPNQLSDAAGRSNTKNLAADIQTAWQQRPELVRFQLQRARLMVELRLNENQLLPALNVGASGAQDVGPGKTSTGMFALDRTMYEGGVTLEVPLQRREARGKVDVASAAITQLLHQERYARDAIQAEVQDLFSNLDRTRERIRLAREEEIISGQVAELERERFQKGQSTLLEVNLREISAAGARTKVIDLIAELQRAEADYRAAIGWLGGPNELPATDQP